MKKMGRLKRRVICPRERRHFHRHRTEKTLEQKGRRRKKQIGFTTWIWTTQNYASIKFSAYTHEHTKLGSK
jgi:hypothetical protein